MTCLDVRGRAAGRQGHDQLKGSGAGQHTSTLKVKFEDVRMLRGAETHSAG